MISLINATLTVFTRIRYHCDVPHLPVSCVNILGCAASRCMFFVIVIVLFLLIWLKWDKESMVADIESPKLSVPTPFPFANSQSFMQG